MRTISTDLQPSAGSRPRTRRHVADPRKIDKDLQAGLTNKTALHQMRIGIDLGGTKIEGIALDGGRQVARKRVDTPRDNYAATIDAITLIVADLEQAAGTRGTVGVGIPGTLSPDSGLVKNANSTWLIGRSLKADLEAALVREVRLANDADCFAVSETADGAAAGADVVFGVIVGTGTGGGITVHGRLLTGPNGITGEWGHNPLPWPDADELPGPPCYCGKRGCIETFLSGPGLTRDHERRSGRLVAAPEIAALAKSGDATATETMACYELRMAKALAAVINIVDPVVVVLGGGLSNIARLYENVPRLWGKFVFSAGAAGAPRTRLIRAAHGDASGVRGAAWLWQA
jgi:fructokinase